MNSILTWATIASPIVGAIAIIVALVIARRSTKETKKQIDAIYNLLDVFVAAQNPIMIEAKRKYEQQLSELDEQIKELLEDIQTVSPFFGQGAMIETMDELYKKNAQCEQLEVLESKRDEIKGLLDLIMSYVERTRKK